MGQEDFFAKGPLCQQLTSLEVFLWRCPHNPVSPRSALGGSGGGVGAQRGLVLKDYGNPAGEEAAPILGLQEALTDA